MSLLVSREGGRQGKSSYHWVLFFSHLVLHFSSENASVPQKCQADNIFFFSPMEHLKHSSSVVIKKNKSFCG